MEKRKRPPLPLDASPQEKYDNLILTFFEEWQDYFGDTIQFGNSGSKEGKISQIDYNYLGFSNLSEMLIFLWAIIESGHLYGTDFNGNLYRSQSYSPRNSPSLVQISFSGLDYCLSLLNSGKNSTRCFVAMAFKEDMEPFYNEGITKAIEVNGFRPIRVDKEHTENEQTINDFIIASIKQSRFCIADLTHQRNGVYFEAGYALGRGLKVIYTCRRDDHANVHFDLKTMQTILYDSPEELREALSLKIQAFILD